METRPQSFAFDASIVQDLRVAMRRIRRAPTLAVAITLTLAFGLGAAAAIAMTATAAIGSSLPYARPDRLVHAWEVVETTAERSPTSYPTLADWRSRSASFAGLEGYDPANLTIGFGDGARMVRGARVTSGFFRLLGIHMPTGRDFLHGDDEDGPAVAIVAQSLALSSGGHTRDGSIVINGVPHAIVGVLPAHFHFALLQDAQVFVPLRAAADGRRDRSDRSIHVVGRLKDDTDLEAAQASLAAVTTTLALDHPDALEGRTALALPLREAVLGPIRPILTALVVAVGLLIAAMCANLALLMLARHLERTPELAMRSALGATRIRILRQLLVESLVPTLAGVTLALMLAEGATKALLGTIPHGVRIGMPYLDDVGLGATSIAIVSVLAVALGTAFGLGPALHVTRPSGRPGDSRTTTGRGDRRVRRGLVTAQVALSFVLLVTSALLVASFAKLTRVETGVIDPATIVLARVPLSGERYEEPRAQRRFYEALLGHIGALPGTSDASLINEVPGGGGGMTTFASARDSRPQSEQPRGALRIVDAGYFRTMGIPLVEGRVLEPGDAGDTRFVAVVSVSAAKRLRSEGSGSVIGQTLRLASSGDIGWDVVGIVGDVKAGALDADFPPVVYVSHLQLPENRMTLVLRTRSTPTAVAADVRKVVSSLDPGVPVYGFATLGEQLADSRAVFTRRLPMILCGVFAAAALALTLIALYAMCMHEVTTRRREFGIRLALGAAPSAIRRLIVRDAMVLEVVGAGAGGIAAILASRSIASLLYGVTPLDWRVYAAVAGMLLLSGFGAVMGPAVRASLVRPSEVMKGD